MLRHIRIAAFLSAALAGSLTSADAPRVVKAVPDNGDANVDPKLKELRIEFDQDMNPGGHSICGGGPSFPEIVGRPRWENARHSIVVSVKLKPNHEYALSINCPAAMNFRSAAGEPVEPYPISFTTGGGGEGATDDSRKLTAEENRAAIAALRRAIDEDYSYRDLRMVEWTKQFDEHAAKMQSAETPATFARAAVKLLAAAQDLHVTLSADGATVATHRRNVAGNFSLVSLSQKVPGWKKHGNIVYSGRFGDGVGYLMITSWTAASPAELEPLYEVLSDLSDAKRLVIDVRPNGGGDELAARDFAGCFVSKPAVYSKNVYRDSSQPKGFGPTLERAVEPKKGRPAFRGKVAVLMGPANVSSCESFLLMMRYGAAARLFGERSGGASGNPKPHDLGNGVTVFLPSWQDMLPDGTLLEGKGVEPDQAVKATAADFARGDPVLDAALKWLRS